MINDAGEPLSKTELLVFAGVILAAFLFALILSLIAHNQEKSMPTNIDYPSVTSFPIVP